ncbi:KLH11-like protein [Mya arenaria]|uniref:KLH11-like protein n=2 Tax=Mya arenaria TaxID=6604 RepID=A0ABY7FAF2_MYAAR|nr:KLH11-like protein [Mya arenaria]
MASVLRMSFCEDKKTVQPISRDMDSSVTLNRSVMRLLYEQMTSQSEFCDVTITFGDKENFEEMKAHSCVLVYSAYFESLYSSGLQEKEQGKVHIGIGKPECIKMALTYLYTGKIHLEFSKLKDILEVADYLQIDDLKADCNRYLRNTELTIKNCVPLCLLSGSYNIEFYSQALEFMRAHLPDVMDTPEAFELSPDSLLDIVSDPALSYVPRISLFNFIVKWVDLDPKERTKYFAELFSSLDLTKIPLKFLTNEVKSCPHVMSSPECLNKYGNIVQMLKKGIIKENSTIDVLFLVGGMDERDRFNKIVFVYLIQEDRWIELSRIPYTLDCTEVTCSLNCKDDALFIVERWRYEDTGGQIKVYKYDLNARNWSSHLTPFEDTDSVPSGSDVHSMFALKETNEFCIISEGFLPPSNVNSVVVCATYYDSELKNIISRTQIFKTKEDAAVSSCIADNRYICSLIFNPLDELNGRNTGQRFLVRDTKGRQVKGFQNFSRGSCRADEILPIGHEIYMCDFEADPGSQGETLVRFDLQKRKWLRSNGSMLLKRMRRMYARCSFGKKIYVVGGDTDDGPVNYADVFDPSEAKWEQIAPIPKPLACVVMCPGKISSEFHTCHANCPHCKVKKSLFDPASQSVTSEDLWSDDSDSEQGDCSIM